MRIVPAKLVEFLGVVPRELIGAMCWPTVGGGGVEKKRKIPNFNLVIFETQGGSRLFKNLLDPSQKKSIKHLALFTVKICINMSFKPNHAIFCAQNVLIIIQHSWPGLALIYGFRKWGDCQNL